MTVTTEPGPIPRPTMLLPTSQLVLISIYWFGINAVWGGYEWFGQAQIERIVGQDVRGTATGVLELLGALVAIVVVPTVGTISDYTSSRFGKRKGYIISGAAFDLLFLLGLASLAIAEPPGWDGEALGSTTVLALYALCLLGLMTSSNVAQGPYQGYVPDLVAQSQVGIASGAVGVMRMLGNIGGAVIMLTIGNALGLWGPALALIGVIELVLAGLTFAFVREGPQGRSREGRPWRAIAREAWGLDVLRERSFLRMTVVRLLFLAGTGIFINISKWYLDDSLGLGVDEQSRWGFVALAAAGIGTALAALPAARLSDRTGRKPVVWGACLVAGLGLGLIAVAPTPPLAVLGLALVGVGAGSYLAVDWALMTETIPLLTSGRYMGLANIANTIAGPLGLVLAGPFVIDAFTQAGLIELGPRVATALGIPFLAVAAIVLVGVHPRRDPRSAEAAGRARGASA